MTWLDTLKKLPQQALALFSRADESELHAKAKRFQVQIDRQIERYKELKQKLDDEPAGKAKGKTRGGALRSCGIELRDLVLELDRLFSQVKDKKFLKEVDDWRNSTQKALAELNQQIRISRTAKIVARVVSRYVRR